MNLNRFTVPALALFLGAAGLVTARVSGAPQQEPPPHSVSQPSEAWEAPPGEFNEMQRQAFHDGLECARKDVDQHRKPNVEKCDDYHHPHVSHDQLDDYRECFGRGYDRAITHLMHGTSQH